jgi:hypothetical protein
MRCKTCRYSLSKLTEHRCPECGRAFDPNDPSTFFSERELRLDHVKMVMRALVCAPFLVWFIWISILFADGIGAEGVFNSPRADFLGAAFLTIIYWPLILVAAIVLYGFFVLVGVLRRRVAARL